jgi:RNA polymerase sigma-70 factor (sigma-E family)
VGVTRGSDEEFIAFVSSSSPGLLRLAWMLSGSESTAEEMVQDALSRVYPRWQSVSASAPLAYARRVLINVNIDRIRARSREGVTVHGAVPERGAVSSVVEDRDHVVRMLQILPPRERQVVVLRYYVGLPEREVADLLGISLGNVKAAGSRGLSKLRGHLKKVEARS